MSFLLKRASIFFNIEILRKRMVMAGQFSIRRLIWAGPLTGILATIANMAFYLITRSAGEKYLISLAGPSNPIDPLPVISILLATFVSALGATIVLAVLVKISHVPLPPFLSISIAALVVSFGGPFSLTRGTHLTTKLLLSTMNIIAAVIIVGGLLYFTYQRK
jgi:hypothetical protein